MGGRKIIVLDTHVWVWWVHGAPELPRDLREVLEDGAARGFGVSAISCWEVAKLVEYDRLELPFEVGAWLDLALSYPGIGLLDLTPRISVESTKLPKPFHRDPADQIIVATARVHDCSVATVDGKIIEYPHVRKVL